jgi:hypothetical protein
LLTDFLLPPTVPGVKNSPYNQLYKIVHYFEKYLPLLFGAASNWKLSEAGKYFSTNDSITILAGETKFGIADPSSGIF